MDRFFLLATCALLCNQCNLVAGQESAYYDNAFGANSDYSIRENRFPSIEERTKLYMSNWYTPPCPGYSDGLIRYEYKTTEGFPAVRVHRYPNHPLVNATQVMEVDSIITPDMAILVDDEIVQNCANFDFDEETEKDKRALKVASRVQFRGNMRMYCFDVEASVLTAWNHIQWESGSTQRIPAIMQFGDNKDAHYYGASNIPLIKKFRSSVTEPSDLDLVTNSHECYSTPRDFLRTIHHTDRFQPIVWKLATSRHYEKLYLVYQKDTVWENKHNAAIFRGQLTGSRDGYNSTLSDEENCMRLKRCRLVYEHGKSELVNASLTSTRDRLPDTLNGVQLVTKKIDIRDMLNYKGLIMIEGNDVASGLKWALLSQSVVLMPPPKHTSWAMEELLRPWVHYIPLDEMASDVEEKMKWVVANDEAARRISERATLWMEDLVFHPDALEDDRLIQEEIIRRYRSHFAPL